MVVYFNAIVFVVFYLLIYAKPTKSELKHQAISQKQHQYYEYLQKAEAEWGKNLPSQDNFVRVDAINVIYGKGIQFIMTILQPAKPLLENKNARQQLKLKLLDMIISQSPTVHREHKGNYYFLIQDLEGNLIFEYKFNYKDY